MNILLINTFHYNRGGDCVYTFELAKLLKSRGHRIIHFAMEHPQNFPSKYAAYFVPEIDLVKELKKGSMISGVKVMGRGIYSYISKKKLSALLNKYPVDIAHIQNIHRHITPSIFHTLKKKNIPIVWTLHDYFLLCPNSTFYSKGRICEACQSKRFYQVVINKCRKDSFGASLVVMLEEYIHRLLGLLKLVDYFITPSAFLRNKLLESGFSEERVKQIPNFIDISEKNLDNNAGEYILYSGRLSYEKGLKSLITACRLITGSKLLIAGDGPLRPDLEEKLSVQNNTTIELLGYQSRQGILELIKKAYFVVVPSEWYENFPYAVLEAFAQKKPVVGARIGGIPELIKEYETGLLFAPGDARDLANKMQWLLDRPGERKRMGERAQKLILNQYNPVLHYERITNLYKQAIRKHRSLEK